MKPPVVKILGDRGVLLSWEVTPSIELKSYLKGLSQLLRLEFQCEVVYTFTEILIKSGREFIDELRFREILNNFNPSKNSEVRCLHIPVCYDAEFALDIDFLSHEKNLRVEEIIQLHTAPKYLLYFIGFLPGFPYLEGLPLRLVTPRRENPRLEVTPGSVGIGGAQTGIYPQKSPGGWHIIGKTPLQTFSVKSKSLTPFENIDLVKFAAISKNKFHHIAKADMEGNYELQISTLK